MAIILHLETATTVCSVALSDNGILLMEKTVEEPREHAKMLTVTIDDLLKQCGYIYGQLDAISVSKGPGSYTGLRIGVATAKGLCFALDKPLLATGTLYSMAECAKQQLVKSGKAIHDKLLFCPMIDARRMEVYSAVFNSGLQEVGSVNALILQDNSFDKWKDCELVFFGDGAEKYKDLISKKINAFFFSDFRLSAEGLISRSEELYIQNAFEDVAYFEPYYLKDFVAGPAKKQS
ncbi:MAG: tRNA (adenosine(37)-N6)-threonylcarbamoyltransferase complex dimerization subunit type 1 TsaB [Bacteroidota bacterium]